MKHKIVLRGILFVIAALSLALILIICTAADEPDGSTPESIVSFIKDCGYSVASPVTKEITIPAEFSDVYESYNKLQKEQGFDLSKYRGESAVSYTFPVIGYINERGEAEEYVEVHIIVYDGRIVGGDIANTRLNGFMKKLR